MKKKCFISGIAGFLGSHIAESLLNDGYEVYGIDDLSGGYERNVPDGAIFKVADCNDTASYSSMLKDVDCVFHCAALAYEGLSVFSPHLVSRSIFTATSGILSASISSGVRRFVYCSSMARYGKNRVPFTENLDPNPVDPYGIAKYASELLVRNLCSVHGIEYNIAIPHNIIGPRQRFDDPYRNVASIFINRMLRKKQPIIYGDGMQMRCFSFIGDVLYCLLELGLDPHIKNDIFNIGPDEEFITILDLAKTIADILDFDIDPIFIPTGRPQEVKLANCSADKARAKLNYKTQYTLRQGILEMINYIANMGPKAFNYKHAIEITTSAMPPTWSRRLI